jgi:hypothetical protein
MTPKIIVKLKGGPAHGKRLQVEPPAPEMIAVPVLLADGLAQCRYYRTEATVEGMPVYEHPEAVH